MNDIQIFLDALPLPALAIGDDLTVIALNSECEMLIGSGLKGRHYITALRQPAVVEQVEIAVSSGSATNGSYLGRVAGKDSTFHVHIAPMGNAMLLTFQDRSAAEDIGQFRRDFVANVSHELRTPLTALLGFVETLKGAARNDDAARDRFLTIMEREASRMARLVDDLLSLSRVEAQERRKPTTLVKLSDLVSSTLAEMEPVIAASGSEVVIDDFSDEAQIPADTAQLRQVITNLVENALKYGASGDKVKVTLSAVAREPVLRGDGIRLTVTDHGDGIEDHHVARLTERFYRIDTHRSREVGGTGLGLAIVKHIVNRHRGRLKFDSALGRGTSVQVILPMT